MKRLVLFLLLAHGLMSLAQAPIIDIHLHAYDQILPNVKAAWAGEDEARELSTPANAKVHFEMVLEEIAKNNIKLGVVSSTSLQALAMWSSARPDLFLTGIQTGNNGRPILSVDSLKQLHAEGTIDVLGELGLQYAGVSPDDAFMRPYYALAEKEGIPVCLHTGLGPPGGPHSFAPKFRTTLGKPSLFEPVLARHPQLKAFLAHAGWPYMSETIALMYVYPQLHVDIGVLAWALPKAAFYSALKELIEAGFGERIMYGSDQMMWPGAISTAIQTIRDAPFLTDSQKRDILYNNAARFLELDQEVIDGHQE